MTSFYTMKFTSISNFIKLESCILFPSHKGLTFFQVLSSTIVGISGSSLNVSSSESDPPSPQEVSLMGGGNDSTSQMTPEHPCGEISPEEWEIVDVCSFWFEGVLISVTGKNLILLLHSVELDQAC